MLKNNKINIYGCLLKLIYTPVFATKKVQQLLGFFSLQKPCFGSKNSRENYSGIQMIFFSNLVVESLF